MLSDLRAYINTDALAHNCRALRARLRPGVRLCAALKADAYGHGAAVVAPVLQQAGADMAAVASIQEAVELRDVGWHRPILVLGNVLACPAEAERRERIETAARHQLVLTLADREGIDCLAGLPAPSPIEVHLKVDTGMGRMGAVPGEVVDLVQRIRRQPHLRLTGFYSHFATADFEQRALVDRQLAAFTDALSLAGDFLPAGILRHLANSAAIITLPEAHFDMVRPGLALYGYHPAERMAGLIDLRPVLRLVSHVTLVKELPAGHCVGYGQTFTTRRPTRLGIVPAGYFDGYVRALSNAVRVEVAGGWAPVIGRVSMDQLAIDLTDFPAAGRGSEVCLIGDDPAAPNSVASLAAGLGTIPYEVTCLLGRRIQRIPTGNSCLPRPARG
jgi:alanine racemase